MGCFVRHPKGRFKIDYEKGIGPSTLLESLLDRKLCEVTFHPEGRGASQLFRLGVSLASRQLKLALPPRSGFSLSH